MYAHMYGWMHTYVYVGVSRVLFFMFVLTSSNVLCVSGVHGVHDACTDAALFGCTRFLLLNTCFMLCLCLWIPPFPPTGVEDLPGDKQAFLRAQEEEGGVGVLEFLQFPLEIGYKHMTAGVYLDTSRPLSPPLSFSHTLSVSLTPTPTPTHSLVM